MSGIPYYRSLKTFRGWFELVRCVLWIALVANFAFASYVWVLTVAHDWTRFKPSSALAVYWPDWFIPVLLFGLAATSLVLSIGLGGRPIPPNRFAAAKRLAIIAVISACFFFGVDTYFGRYQYSVDIATVEYWDGGGAEHVYYTWWWFNDRWFHSSYWHRTKR
jgi:hypothetical protein